MDLSKVAFIFAILGVGVGVGVWVNEDVAGEFDTVTTTNETQILVNKTWKTLDNNWLHEVTSVTNGTNTLTSGNWTTRVRENGISQINVTYIANDNTSMGDSWNITYSSRHNITEYLVMRNSTKGMASLAEWAPLIAVVIAAAIIIAAIGTWFTGKRSGF